MRSRRFSLLRLTGVVTLLPRLRRRRPSARLIIAVAISGASALGISEFVRPMPRLVWNASASPPLGFYWVRSDQAASRGDFVLAALPEAARRLAAARGYLLAGVPVVKRVAALTGDVVCADSAIVVINDRVAAQTLLMDRQDVRSRHGAAAECAPTARSSC
jgi:type IV secretory pathway protease TraF